MSETTQENNATQNATQENNATANNSNLNQPVTQENPYTNQSEGNNSKLSATENLNIGNQQFQQQQPPQQQFVQQTQPQPVIMPGQQVNPSQQGQQMIVPASQTMSQVPATQSQPVNVVMDQVSEISMDDDVKLNRLDRFPTMAKDEMARIAFILFDDKDAPLLKMSSVFYHSLSNTSFLAPTDKNLYAKVVEVIGKEPAPKFGAIVLKYNTDKQGNLFPNWTFEIFAFVFGADKYPTFKNLHREWGLKNHDILLNCTDGSKFQKMTISLARECLWRQLDPTIINTVIAKAQELHVKQLAKQLGRKLSDQEIMITTGLIKPPETMGGPQGGVYNPFPGGGGMVPNNQMLPSGGGMIPAGGPAVNLASQVNQGVPQSGNFSHLLKS